MTRFIALDPSTTVTGWAVFEGEQLVAWGRIDTRKTAYADRFVRIVAGIAEVYTKYRFDEIVIEDVSYAWHSKNRNRNIAGLQSVFRSIQDYSITSNFRLTAYNPATWKNSVVGAYSAPKEVVKNNILLRFPRVPDNLTDHEYDAIGIGVYHAAKTMYERGYV